MFLTLRPYGLKPTRLLCPWDSLGKNTGVGCHFLLQTSECSSIPQGLYFVERPHTVWLKSLSINLRILLWILPRLSKYFCKCKNQKSVQLSLSHVKFCVHVCTPTHIPFSVSLGGKTCCSTWLFMATSYPLNLLTYNLGQLNREISLVASWHTIPRGKF